MDFTLPEFRAMNDVTWKWHVDDFAKGRYNTILGRDILTEIWLNVKSSDHVIEADDGPLKGIETPIVYLGRYRFKDINTVIIIPKKSFTNADVKEVYGSEC